MRSVGRDAEDVAEVGGVMGAGVLPTDHALQRIGVAGSNKEPVLPVPLPDPPLDGSQALPPLLLLGLKGQRPIHPDQVGDEDPPFLEVIPRSPDRVEQLPHHRHQLREVARRHREGALHVRIVLRDVEAKAIGPEIDRKIERTEVLLVQLATDDIEKLEEDHLQLLLVRDGVAEGAGATDTLRRRLLIEGDPRHPPQLIVSVQPDDGKVSPHPLRCPLDEVVGGLDAEALHPEEISPADAPHITDRCPLECPDDVPPAVEGVDTTGLGVLLGVVAGDLSEGLRGGDTDAGRDAHAPENSSPDLPRQSVVLLIGGKVDEALVYGVDLLLRHDRPDHAHHAAREISVKNIIAGTDADVLPLHQVPDLEKWHAHRDAECLRLIGPADDAAVVIGETDDGSVAQLGSEDPLATDIEVVAVDQTVHGSDPSRSVDDVGDHAPEDEVVLRVDPHAGVGAIGRDEVDLAAVTLDKLDIKFPIHAADHHIIIVYLEGAINDHDISLVDIGPDHRVAHDTGEEGGRRVADQLPIQVDRLQPVVLCGRGEAGEDPLLGKGKGNPLPHLHLVKLQ